MEHDHACMRHSVMPRVGTLLKHKKGLGLCLWLVVWLLFSSWSIVGGGAGVRQGLRPWSSRDYDLPVQLAGIAVTGVFLQCSSD